MANLSNSFLIGVQLDLSTVQAQFLQLKTEIDNFKNQTTQAFAAIQASAAKATNPNSGANKPSSGQKTQAQLAALLPPAVNNQKKLASSTKDAANEINRFNQGLSDTARRVFIWGSLSAGIFGTIEALREAYDFTLKINTAMAELQKVLPAEENFNRLRTQGFNLAIEFGRDPKEAFDVLTKFGQAGLDTAQAVEATRIALLALNTTGADTEQTVNALIASSRIFDISWGNMINVIDKIQKVQADFAVSAKDLIVSISTIGPAVQAVNGDINDLFAVIAGMGEAARVSGKEASNALKTIFARIGTEEGIDALNKLGIAVFESGGKFRPINTILGELSKRLETATDHELQLAAVQLGGVRQYNKLLATLQNYMQVQNALEASEGSYGEALTANQIMMASYERQLQSISAANQKALVELFESLKVNEGVIGFQKTLSGMLKVLASLPTTITMVVGALGAMSLALKLSKFVFVGKKDVSQLMSFGAQIAFIRRDLPGLQQAIGGNRETLRDFLRSIKATTLGLKGLRIAMITTFVLPAAIIGISLLVEKLTRVDPIVKGAEERLKSFKDTLLELSFKDVLGTDVETKFVKLTNLLRELSTESKDLKSPDSVNKISSVFEGMLKNGSLDTVAFEKFVEVYKSYIQFLNQQNSTPITQAFGPLVAGVSDLKNALSFKVEDQVFQQGMDLRKKLFLDLTKSIKSTKDQLETLGLGDALLKDNIFTGGLPKSFTIAEEITAIVKSIEELIATQERLAEASGKSFNLDEFAKSGSKAADQYNTLIDKAAETYLSFIDLDKLAQLASNKAGLKLDFDQGQDNGRQLLVYDAILQKIIERLKEVQKVSLSALETEQFKNALVDLLGELDKNQSATKLYIETLDEVAATSALKKSGSALVEGFLAEFQALDKLSGMMDGMGDAYDSLNEKKKLAKATLNGLLDQYRLNAKELESLRIEQEFLNKSIQGKPKEISPGTFVTQEIKDYEKKVESIKVKINALEISQQNVNKTIEEAGPLLIAIANGFEQAANGPERLKDLLEANSTLLKNLYKDTQKLNALFNNDPIVLFEADDKNQKALLDFQKAFIDIQAKASNWTKVQVDNKKQDLEIAYQINRVEELRQALLDKISEKIKAQNDLAKDYLDINQKIKNAIIDAATEIDSLGKVRGRDNVLKFELDALEKKKQIEIENAAISNKLLKTNRDTLDLEIESINVKYEGAKAEAIINDILEKRKARYEEVSQEVGNIKSAITSWLTDQTQLFDDIQSRGSLFKTLGRGASGIAGAIAQADADSIADALTGKTQKFVENVRGGIRAGFADGSVDLTQKINSTLTGIALPTELEKSITSASKMLVDGSFLAITSAWQYIAQVYFPQLNKSIIDGLNSTPFEMKIDPNAGEKLASMFAELGRTSGPNTSLLVSRLQDLAGKFTELNIKQQSGQERLTQAEPVDTGVKDSGILSTHQVQRDQLKAEEDTRKFIFDMKQTTEASLNEYKKASSLAEETNKLLFSTFQTGERSKQVLETGFGNGASINAMIKTSEDLNEEFKKQRRVELTNATIRTLGNFLSTSISAALAKSTGASAEAVNFGQSIGSTLAGAATSGNPFAMAFGALSGGVLAALTGAGKQEEQLSELVKIEKNTASLVDRLSPEIINAPAAFSIPSGTGFGSGNVTIQNNITVTDGSISNANVDTLTRQLESIYSRSSRNTNITR